MTMTSFIYWYGRKYSISHEWGRMWLRARGKDFVLYQWNSMKGSSKWFKIYFKEWKRTREMFKGNINKNANNLSFCFHLGSLLCNRNYSLVLVLCCLENNVYLEKWMWIIFLIQYISNVIWYQWTYKQNRNRPTDIENKFLATKGEKGVGGNEFGINTYTLLYVK